MDSWQKININSETSLNKALRDRARKFEIKGGGEECNVRGFTDEGNAQTAKHEELKPSFQAAPFAASRHVAASYQAAEELSVA